MYEYPPLRSFDRERIQSYVRFVNKTDRRVDIIWVHFDGRYVCYQSLESKQFIDINTFKEHPWIALDSETRDKMHLAKKYVYQPQTTQEYIEQHYPNRRYDNIPQRRIEVKITLPVHSLRYACLLSIKNSFREPSEVDSLDLPKSLIEDLKKVIVSRNNFNIIPNH